MKLLASVFNAVINFFDSVGAYISFDILLYAAVGVLVLLLIVLIFQVRNSFEIRMVRAIDSLNNFLVNNPKITQDNLVAFNEKMKKVPATLRVQWQQFMLYRENKPSTYMSFKNCVENPMKSTSYKHSMKHSAVLAGVLIGILTLFGIFANGGIITDLNRFAKHVLLLPLCIGIIYFVAHVFISARLSAITADLFQNFQYFEKNIDKATQTLPDYVDYEVLFSKREIRQGIPVLFEYLERRAQIEQQELEKAREKNIEHEKYNFDKAGLEPSLVLERAMQEAERYLSDRNRYMQEIEKSENEIGSIQAKFKEYTKEYQRKMQASKENVERLKTQLDQAASNIEANYIKKQYSEEIARQQSLEKDFDAKSDENKQNILVLQQDIDEKNTQIDQLRGILEDSMMSEFDSYNKKVYDKVEDAVNKNQQKRLQTMDEARIQAEERLAEREKELERLYDQYHTQTERLEKRTAEYNQLVRERDEEAANAQHTGLFGGKNKKHKNNFAKQNFDEDINDVKPSTKAADDVLDEMQDNEKVDLDLEKDNTPEVDVKSEVKVEDKNETQQPKDDLFEKSDDGLFDLPDTKKDVIEEDSKRKAHGEILDNLFDKEDEEPVEIKEKVKNIKHYKQEVLSGSSDDKATNPATEELRAAFLAMHGEKPKPKPTDNKDDDDGALKPATQPQVKNDKDEFDSIFLSDKTEDQNDAFDYSSKLVEDNSNTDNLLQDEDTEEEPFDLFDDDLTESEIEENEVKDNLEENDEENEEVVVKRPGRPRGRPKKTTTTAKVKKPRGRPRKAVTPVSTPTAKRGRPKKATTTPAGTKPAAKRGRPKKETTGSTKPVEKKSVGRPKKNQAVTTKTTGRGRPKKQQTEVKKPVAKKPVGRPKKATPASTKPAAKRGRPKKATTETNKPAGKRGRPKKSLSLDEQIQALNAKILEQSQQLDKQRAALEQDIQRGFNNKALTKQRNENEKKQKRLDNIISQLDVLASNAVDKSAIESGIKYLEKDLDDLDS